MASLSWIPSSRPKRLVYTAPTSPGEQRHVLLTHFPANNAPDLPISLCQRTPKIEFLTDIEGR